MILSLLYDFMSLFFLINKFYCVIVMLFYYFLFDFDLQEMQRKMWGKG